MAAFWTFEMFVPPVLREYINQGNDKTDNSNDDKNTHNSKPKNIAKSKYDFHFLLLYIS
jgi:hypothetical protein